MGRGLGVFFEAIEAVGAAIGLDLGIEQFARLDGAARFGQGAVKDHAEIVTRLDVATEIQLVAEQLDDLSGEGRGGPSLGGAFIERALHLALSDGGFRPQFLFQFAQLERAIEGPREGQG